MSDIAIRVEGLGKKYTIGHQKSGDFRNSVGEKLGSLFGRRANSEEEFWALKDVSFEINRGEAVGIIGRNGAGKSTLLKILSRITDPTTGRYEINGRVSSLLEVGTGFHSELTGRENIYLNGTILGMKRKEIKSKFDEIVTFSGVEKFLDTPVKHYSSGMKVRLAFSVAAHLEPEILIVDEVLAVGDAEFQKKCLGKMDEVSKREGRTVLFVSHNMAAIKTLCARSILLENGSVLDSGETSAMVNRYLSKNIYNGKFGVFDLVTHPNKKNPNRGLTRGRLLRNGEETEFYFSKDNFKAEFDFIDNEQLNEVVFGLVIKDVNQVPLIGINNWDLGLRLNKQVVKKGKIIFEIESLPIYGDGKYYVDLYFGDAGNNYDTIENAMSFTLKMVDVFSNGKILNPKLNVVHPGKVKIELNED